MTNKTKKMLSILASTAILAGFTADITLNSNPATANAAKHHKKKKAKKKKISRPKNTNPGKEENSATAGTTPQSNYQSLGEWYIANDKYLYNRYNGKGLFQNGLNDSRGAGYGFTMDPSKYNNDYYKEGWIIGYVNNDGNGYYTVPTDSALYGATADNYNKAINIYNAGANFIQSTAPNSSISYNQSTNNWSN